MRCGLCVQRRGAGMVLILRQCWTPYGTMGPGGQRRQLAGSS